VPNDIDSGNEADSESEKDIPDTSAMEPLVAYLDDSYSSNITKNDSEWIINENIAFDYSCV